MAHLSCVGETVEGLREILDQVEALGIENILALRGDPPRGEEDFVQPEGGLGSAAELAELHRRELLLRDRGHELSRGSPRGGRPRR